MKEEQSCDQKEAWLGKHGEEIQWLDDVVDESCLYLAASQSVCIRQISTFFTNM